MAGPSSKHKRPRLEEEGADADSSRENFNSAARVCIVIHYNGKTIPLSFSRESSPNSLETAIRTVCLLGVRHSIYLKNEKGEVCVVDSSLPQGNYFLHVAPSSDMPFRLPFAGVRNFEKLRDCVMSSYCFLLHELPAEIHQLLFSFLTPTDILNALKVCKMWNNISNDPELWQRLYTQRFLGDSEVPDPQQALAKIGWKNVFFVSHLFGVSTREIRMQLLGAVRALFEKSLLEVDDENFQAMALLAGVDRFVIVVFIHLPLVPFRTTTGMLTFQLALPSTTVQISYPFNFWSWRTSLSTHQSPTELAVGYFKPFLDESLVSVKRAIEAASKEKLMFSRYTLPVFLPLPPTYSAPRSSCEKIIICIDLCTPERNPFVGQRCATEVSLLDVVKLGVKTFVDVKHKLNERNQFSICVLGETADIHLPFTNNVDDFSTRLDDLIPCGKLRSFDMSSLFSTILNCIETDIKNATDKSCVYRCVFIYCRSDSVPVWSHGHQSGRKVLSREDFFFDVLYLHERPCTSNMPQEVFDALTDVYHSCGTAERANSSYYCENSTSVSRHFLCWAHIMAMPSQRPQQVENLPIVPYPDVLYDNR